jgi:hypothetical protein
MRMLHCTASLLVLLWLTVAALPAVAATLRPAQPPLRVRVFVDKPTINVGDLIRYTIDVDAASNVTFAMPQFAEHLGGFAVSDWIRNEATFGKDGRLHQTNTYVMETYLTGVYEIPPARIPYAVNAQTNAAFSTPIVVEVVSVAGAGDLFAGIKDIQGPVALVERLARHRARSIIIAVCAVLALAGIIQVIITRLRRPTPPPPPVPAHERAYAALRALFARHLVEAGHVKEYYFALSIILRHYIEDRFALRAPEQTTEEFLQALGISGTFAQRYQEVLSNFLHECDLVKFANQGANAADAARTHDCAVQFIEETRVRHDEPEPEE